LRFIAYILHLQSVSPTPPTPNGFEKFPSEIGGHLMSMNIPPQKDCDGSYMNILLKNIAMHLT
jgi:hypothetical protein